MISIYDLFKRKLFNFAGKSCFLQDFSAFLFVKGWYDYEWCEYWVFMWSESVYEIDQKSVE